MKKQPIIWAIFLILLLLSIIPITSSFRTFSNKIIYVDYDGNADFTSIQDAIDNASKGDIIYVFNGTYFENIFINKTISLIGEDKNTTIIDASKNGDVIYVGFPANRVYISGFTICNSGKRQGNGIFDGGIDLHSDQNVVSNNILTRNYMAGLILFGSSHNIIEHNYFGDSNRSGIEFLSGRFNQVSNNTIMNNSDFGISLSANGNSSGNLIILNILENNRQGIIIFHSGNTIIHNNFINNYVTHAISPFNILTFSPSRNYWNENFFDNCTGGLPRYIRGLFGFNIDWHPVQTPYDIKPSGV